MRKLPSSASAGNLRQLVDASSSVVLYDSNGSSMLLPVSPSPIATTSMNSPNVAMSNLAMDVTADNGEMPTIVNTEDRSCRKKGLAYRHTKFHRLLGDAFGKSYERRLCNYCDAVFSFKGGTTSAALRHLKTAHPEKLLFNTGSSEVQSIQGDFSITNDENRPMNVQENVSVTRSEQVVALTETCAEFCRRNDDVATAVVDPMVAADTAGSSEKEISSSSRSKNDKRRPTPKRKRGDDESNATERGSVSSSGGDNSSAERGEVDNRSGRRGPSSMRTPSQTAIAHFLHHYADELSHPAMRLRFARHLTHNVAEAEMYNVLDPATQLEFIREFAHAPPNT